MQNSKINQIFLAFVLIAIGVACRLLPHAWNFAPIVAIALFAGFYFRPWQAITIPVVSMFIGDIWLGFYSWQLMIVVYSSYIIIGGLGCLLKKYKSTETILAGSIISSILFFAITNWAVWQFSSWYAPSLTGLMECYTMAIPFFRNAILGDLFYVSVFFGAYEAVSYMISRKVFSLKNSQY